MRSCKYQLMGDRLIVNVYIIILVESRIERLCRHNPGV